MIKFLGQAFLKAKYFAARFLHGESGTPTPTPPTTYGSGVGGGTTGHHATRRKAWLQLTAEKSRRYEELFQQLLAKEIELEEAQKSVVEEAQKKRRRIVKLQQRVAKIIAEIERIEAAAKAEEEHLIMAFLLD